MRGRRLLVLCLVLAVAVVSAGGLFVLRDRGIASPVAVGGGGDGTGDADRYRTPAPTAAATGPPEVVAPPVLAAVAHGPMPSAAGVAAVLRRGLGARDLGARVGAVVADVQTGRRLLSRGNGLVPPASTAKIVTAVAVLATLGPDARLTTSVVRAGSTVVLLGGGDPTLTATPPAAGMPAGTSLPALAAATVRALTASGVRRVRVVVDAAVFSGSPLAPGWKKAYVTMGDVAPVSGLAVDDGRIRADRRARAPDPATAAGGLFARLLTSAALRRGAARLTVAGPVVHGRAPAGARPLASVRSAPIGDLVERMLTTSDNDLAEALARQAAIRSAQPGSFAGAAVALRAAATAAGVPAGDVQMVDGSGLSTRDRLRPSALVTLLGRAAAGDPRLRPVVTGLPVAGFTGTLQDRYRSPPALPAAGSVRAKTGTLNGVSTLAGITTDADGRLLAFAFFATEALSRHRAQTALDGLASAVTRCGCR